MNILTSVTLLSWQLPVHSVVGLMSCWNATVLRTIKLGLQGMDITYVTVSVGLRGDAAVLFEVLCELGDDPLLFCSGESGGGIVELAPGIVTLFDGVVGRERPCWLRGLLGPATMNEAPASGLDASGAWCVVGIELDRV